MCDQRVILTKPSTIHLLGFYLMSELLRSQTTYFSQVCPGHRGKLVTSTTQNYSLILFKYNFFTEASQLLESSAFIEHIRGIKGDLRRVV